MAPMMGPMFMLEKVSKSFHSDGRGGGGGGGGVLGGRSCYCRFRICAGYF